MALCACGCGKHEGWEHDGRGRHDQQGHDGGHGYGGGTLLGPDGSVVKVVVPALGEEDDEYDDYDDNDFDFDDFDLGELIHGHDDDDDDDDLPHARKVDRSNVEGWPSPEDYSKARTMIALRVPPKVGGRYGRDAHGVVDLEPLQDRHITLLRLGRQTPTDRQRLHDVVRRWMKQGQWQPLQGEAQGWGTFTKPDNGGRHVLWMGWNIPGLSEMRHDLKQALQAEGFDCESGFDFVPHETVGYAGEVPSVLPVFPDQPVQHTFDGIVVAENDDWMEYPFHTGLVLASGRPAVVAALEAAAAEYDAAVSAVLDGGFTAAFDGELLGEGASGAFAAAGGSLTFSADSGVRVLDPGVDVPVAASIVVAGLDTAAHVGGVIDGFQVFGVDASGDTAQMIEVPGYFWAAPALFGQWSDTGLPHETMRELQAALPTDPAVPVARVDVPGPQQARPEVGTELGDRSGLGPGPDGFLAAAAFAGGRGVGAARPSVDLVVAKAQSRRRILDLPIAALHDTLAAGQGTAHAYLQDRRGNRIPVTPQTPVVAAAQFLREDRATATLHRAYDGALLASAALWVAGDTPTLVVGAAPAPDFRGLRAALDVADGQWSSLIAAGSLKGHTAGAAKLKAYWSVGPGGVRKIRWGTKGDWTRCRRHLSKYLGPGAAGYCTNLHKMMTGMHTGSMAHRIRFGWGGKPGSYWAKVAAKKGVKASAGLPMVFAMDDGRVIVPVSGDPANPLVRLLGGEPPEKVEFRIPLLLPEGVESGDGRTFERGVVDVRDTPIPLLWQPNSMQGHDGAVIVGRIDRVERTDDGIGNCHGVFDTSPMALEAVRMIRDGFLRGVSADLDKFEAKILGKGAGTATAGKKSSKKDDDDVVAPDKMSIKSGRIMAATLVAKPAFEQAKIELVEGGGPVDSQVEVDVDGVDDGGVAMTASAGEVLPDGVYRGVLGDELRSGAARFVGRLKRDGFDASLAQFSALVASGADGAIEVPAVPPAEWFQNPDLPKPTHLTITDEGRVFGHIAAWHVDHIGMGFGTRPPKSKSNYAYFRTGLLRTAEGNDIRVGQLTLAGGHASLQADAQAAVKHYDDTNSAFADVVAGEDRHGIWVSGALRPGVTETQLRVARASSPSGDWRPINGRLELVAVCQVNVPGFPVVEARVASGAVAALVAAGTAPLVASLVSGDGVVAAADDTGTVVVPTDLGGVDELGGRDPMMDETDEAVGMDDVEPVVDDVEDPGDEVDEYAVIVDEASLAAAVGEFVCKTGKKSKKGIVSRAKSLGLDGMLPDGWVDEVMRPQVAAVEAARVAAGEAAAAAEAAVLQQAFLSAKAKMLRSRVGQPSAGFVASGGTADDADVVDGGGLDEAIRGLTIREAAALLFAAQEEADAAVRAEAEALTAAVAAGEALADGSWWITGDDDLMGAVESFGSLTGSRERRVVQNHIKRRARELGSFELVPRWWWSPRELAEFDGDGIEMKVSDAVEAAIREALAAQLAKVAEEGAGDTFDVEAFREQLAADFGVAAELIPVDDMDEVWVDDMPDDAVDEVIVVDEAGPGDDEDEMGVMAPDMEEEPDVDDMGGMPDNDMDGMDDAEDMEDRRDEMYAADGVTAAAGELADTSPDGATLSKQPVSSARRKEMAKKGTALPDGSYPIADVADLRRAIKSYGRAKESDRAKVRRHIIKRARALGKADLIPDSWPKR